MPVIIDTQETASIGLEELVDYLHQEKIDTMDEEAMVAAGFMLKRLANNRTFLGDIALKELKERKNLGAATNRYGPQVIMLHPPARGQTFFMRANFWPAANDHIFRSSGPEQFFYHHPHDHSFNFLTVGYWGPGYRSNYYTYDYNSTAGFPGEDVNLRFVENMALAEGKVMLYRACIDIHDQLPPDSMSISLNIMELSVRGSVIDQYSFDPANGTVTNMINRMPMACLMPLIAACGDGNGTDYLHETVKGHMAGRVRMAALRGLAAAESDPQECLKVLELGLGNDDPLVSGWARGQVGKIAELVQA